MKEEEHEKSATKLAKDFKHVQIKKSLASAHGYNPI